MVIIESEYTSPILINLESIVDLVGLKFLRFSLNYFNFLDIILVICYVLLRCRRNAKTDFSACLNVSST